MQMSAVGITENAKGDNKKFEIWSNSREEVFIVQVTPKYKSAASADLPVSLQNKQRNTGLLRPGSDYRD